MRCDDVVRGDMQHHRTFHAARLIIPRHLCAEYADICDQYAAGCERAGDMQECVDACRARAEQPSVAYETSAGQAMQSHASAFADRLAPRPSSFWRS